MPADLGGQVQKVVMYSLSHDDCHATAARGSDDDDSCDDKEQSHVSRVRNFAYGVPVGGT